MKLWTIDLKMGVPEVTRSNVPNLMKDVPNFVKDVPNFVNDVPKVQKCFSNWRSIPTSERIFGPLVHPSQNLVHPSLNLVHSIHNLIYVKFFLHYGKNDCPNIFFL